LGKVTKRIFNQQKLMKIHGSYEEGKRITFKKNQLLLIVL